MGRRVSVYGGGQSGLPRGRAKLDQENKLSVFALFEFSQF